MPPVDGCTKRDYVVLIVIVGSVVAEISFLLRLLGERNFDLVRILRRRVNFA